MESAPKTKTASIRDSRLAFAQGGPWNRLLIHKGGAHHRVGYLCLSLALLLFALGRAVVHAQITNVTGETATPTEGVGHDYIKAFSETVDPASGSLSVRINLPTSKGRGLTIPISIGFDSNGFRHLKPGYYPYYGTAIWASNTGAVGQGGWIYSVPQINAEDWTQNVAVLTGFNNGPVYTVYPCQYDSGYVFRDGRGSIHSLGLGSQWAYSSADAPYCTGGGINGGGDSQVRATLTTPSPNGPGGQYLPAPIAVYGTDGTVYHFKSLGVGNSDDTPVYALPDYIEDRNGNIITISGTTFKDTLGRTLLSYSGFGPAGQTNALTVSGLTYQVTWKSVSANYPVPSTWVGSTNGPNSSYGNCSPLPGVNDTQTVISKITLPNGTGAFNFYYGTDATPHSAITNSYGLLSEIDYPSGGWVQYTWKPADTTNVVAIYPAEISQAGTTCSSDPYAYCPAPVPNGCAYQYQTRVVASRTERFGGASSGLTQTFSYRTNWGPPLSGNVGATTWLSKITTVSTTDDALGKNAQTVYNYSPVTGPSQPFSGAVGDQIPVESSVKYYDWGNITTPLRTVNKTWYNQYDLASEQTVLETGQSSKVTYCYVGTNCVPGGMSQLQEKDEYDFGATSASRKTITTYQGFSGSLGMIADAPCKVVVYDGTGTRYAETDYYYDGGTTLCGAPGPATTTAVSGLVSGTHDEVLFAATKTTPRGNVTQKTLWSNQGTSPTTKYTYDETGQLRTKIDPCGNPSGTCSDMSGSNHTTTYSYADSYTILSGSSNVPYTPSGATNAYLTSVTNPLGQTSTFTYDYNTGQLTKSTDENTKSSTYVYNDPLSRPRTVSYPDGGQTTLNYTDSPPSPYVTTTTLISASSGTSRTMTTVMDGMAHVVQTQLTSDPDGTDYVDISYDGFGRVLTRSNPHRSSPTDGTTSYVYDGLGRTILLTQPDSSLVNTSYSGNCTTVTDETGKARKSCTDGLGRLTEVDEPGAGATTASAGNGSVSIGGAEQTIPATSGTALLSLSDGGGCISNGFGGYYPKQGSVSVTVYGVQTAAASTSWGSTCDPQGNYGGPSPSLSSIAQSLAASLAASSAGVTATSSNSTFRVTAKATGAGTNYALSTSYTTNSNTETWVSAPASLTGGKNGVSDSGTVRVTVNGFPASTSYGSGSTSGAIASALANQLSGSGSPVTIQLNGTSIALTAVGRGSASDYTLTGSTTWNSQSFSSPSFNITLSGSTLTGGADATVGNTPLVTLYTYDVLDNLRSVQQKGGTTDSTQWRNRTFTYDSLSRLLCAANPEVQSVSCPTSATGTFPTGAVTYSYDVNGNLSSKVMPAPGLGATGQTTQSYSYDVFNRLTKKTYTNPSSATVQYGYDGTALSGCTVTPPSISSPTNLKGRRSAMCSGGSASSWSYDAMGRPIADARKNQGVSASTKTVNYVYNVDGSVSFIFYPSGNNVHYTVGGAGRILQVDDTYNIYVNSAAYSPSGALVFGGEGPIVITNAYNNRQQPILQSATVPNQAPVLSLCYDFHDGQAINTPPCQFSAYKSGNNGNVFQIFNNVSTDATKQTVFQYDMLNRLSQANTATTGTNCWSEIYTVDPWGNLTNRSGLSSMGGCNTELMNDAPATVQNHLTGISYDAAGNVLNDAVGNPLTFDAENRIVTDAGYTYSYDADGTRIAKASGSTGTMYWPGLNGETLTETNLSGTINEEYVYFNGQRVLRIDQPSGAMHYYFSDHLGSAAVITDASGNPAERYFYYPYGGLLYSAGSDPNRYKFAGKERDSESGLDMFGARYYGSSLGRFMTPDWAAAPTAVPYAHYGNPQSLNLYSYVQNNPTTSGDPDGHCPQCVEEVLEYLSESPAGEAVENWGAQALAGAGTLLGTAAAAMGNGQLGNAYPMYYHGEIQNPNGTSIFLSKDNGAQSGDKNVPNPNGSKGAPDHQQTADEEAAKMGPNGQREVRVQTPGGEKGSRVIDAAKVENGKVTEATQVVRPNKNGTPPAREVRAASDIQKATGVQPKLVPVRPCTSGSTCPNQGR